MKKTPIAACVACALPCCALSFLSTPSLAQTNPPPETVVVTASRVNQPLSTALGQVIVITREDIDAAGPISLAELLQARAGAEIRTTGGPGQPASVFLRGANSTHTLVLVDGLRLNSATAGLTSIESLPLDLIEKIEIVKGPLSSLYGSDALGGVVQIFTRGDAEPLLFGRVGLGNDRQRKLSAGFATRESATRFSLSASHAEIDGPSATLPSNTFLFNPDRDPHEVQHVNLKLAHTFANGETLSVSGFQTRAKTRFDGGPSSDDQNRQKLSGIQLESRNQFAPGWNSVLTAGRGTDDLDISGSFPARFKTEQDQIAWVNEFKTRAGHLTAGAEARNEKVSGTTRYEKTRRETTSVFAGYAEQLGAQRLEFSLRRDEEDQFGRRNTGSLAYGLALTPRWQAYARGARAFRAPSFNDLYFPSSPQFGPSSNPLLKPERADGAEVGLSTRWPGGRFQATGFDQKIEDLIVFVFGSGPQNVRRARIRGVELEAETKAWGFDWRASLTRQRPEDQDTKKRLRNRAETQASLSVARRHGPWRGQLSLVGSGERFDSNNEAPSSRLGGYGLVNATLEYAIDKRWSVELAGANLADKRYELAQGYQPAGRNLLVTLKYSAR